MSRFDQTMMRAIPTGDAAGPRTRRPFFQGSAVRRLALMLALSLVGLGACGDDVPPGARPISEVAPSSAPAPVPSTGSPASAAPGMPVAAPRVVALDPPDGATDVDPARTSLSVTFDRQMSPEGWAWVVEREETAPTIGEARFDPMGRVNTVDVELEPGHDYVIWINSDSYQYFKGIDGTPAVPYRWSFRTRGGDREPGGGADAPSVAMLSSRQSVPVIAGPRVVTLDPPNGATGVDPGRDTISVTFDRPMEASWAWVTEAGTTPPPTSGEPTFSPDRKTNFLPVDLAPATTYTIWVNSDKFQHFRDDAGNPAQPVRWVFTTGPGAGG